MKDDARTIPDSDMLSAAQAGVADGASGYVAVEVWDAPTRILHWLNALTVMTLVVFALTMEEGLDLLALSDEAEEPLKDALKLMHSYAGYFLAVTYTARVIWGFVGNKHARFIDMVPYKKEDWVAIAANIRWYLSGLRGHAPVSIGHNPLASLFYLPLFVVLGLQVVTGVILAGLEYSVFPGTVIQSIYGIEGVDTWGDAAEEVHEFGMYFILFYFCCHMGGLIVHELGEKSSMVSAMIHGRKYFPRGSVKE